MKFVVDRGWEHLLGPWWAEKCDSDWFPNRGRLIGLYSEDQGIVAAALYEGFNGASVMCHIASEGKAWMTRDFLWYFFWYPFEELKVRKLLAPIASENERSVRLAKSVGFSLEATLQDASPRGNMLILTMTKDQCRWLDLKGRQDNGKAKSPCNSRLRSGSDCSRRSERKFGPCVEFHEPGRSGQSLWLNELWI